MFCPTEDATLCYERGEKKRKVKAILLAAGFGTRLYPLTKNQAKPLLPIRGRPVIEHIIQKIDYLECIEQIYIISNARFYPQFIKWHHEVACQKPVFILKNNAYSEKDKLGAIADLAYVIEQAKIDDDLLIIGGDNLFNFSLDIFIQQACRLIPNPVIGAYHMKQNAARTKKFGIIQHDRHMRITNFLEKPKRLNGSRLVSLCLYFLPKEKINSLFEYLRLFPDKKDVIGNYISWLCQQDTVYAHRFNNGQWIDIGDIDSYTEAVCSF